MSVMTAAGAGLPTDRPLTVEDLDLLPDDANKYELDDGVLVVSPAPAVNHQLVLQRLSELLGPACPPEYLVLPGPGVEITKYQYRIPDLVVVRTDSVGFEDKSVINPLSWPSRSRHGRPCWLPVPGSAERPRCADTPRQAPGVGPSA